MMEKGFISEIIKGFEKFVDIFKEKGLVLVTFIMILFLVFYNLILQPLNVNNIIEKMLEKERTERQFIEDNMFEERLKVERTIIPQLDDIVERDTLITRVLCFEVHDGVQTKGKLDLLFMSCTFESISSELTSEEPIGDNFQRQSINSLFPSGLQTITYKKYVFWDENSTNRFYKKLTHFGVNYAMCIPIKNKKNIPLVLLVLCSDKKFNAADKYNFLEHTITGIGNILINET